MLVPFETDALAKNAGSSWKSLQQPLPQKQQISALKEEVKASIKKSHAHAHTSTEPTKDMIDEAIGVQSIYGGVFERTRFSKPVLLFIIKAYYHHRCS